MKAAFDTSVAQSVSAYAITYAGEFAGKIVSVRGKSGAVTSTLCIWSGILRIDQRALKLSYSAGGFGYDKGIASIERALYPVRNANAALTKLHAMLDKGYGLERAFESVGYHLMQVL